MKVQVIKQFSVFMPNKPGALSRLTKLISDKNINMLGIASEVRDDSGMVRIAVDGDMDISGILSGHGFASVETSILSIEMADKPGELFRATRALADGRINITTVYGTSLTGNTCRILVAVENVVKAKSVLDEAAAKA